MLRLVLTKYVAKLEHNLWETTEGHVLRMVVEKSERVLALFASNTKEALLAQLASVRLRKNLRLVELTGKQEGGGGGLWFFSSSSSYSFHEVQGFIPGRERTQKNIPVDGNGTNGVECGHAAMWKTERA